jgi:K+-sensing histidine kinase KdpD
MLVSAAMTDELVGRLGIDGESLTVPRGSGPLWKTFDEGKLRAFEGERAIGFGSKSVGSVPALFVPLGDHGVLVIGTDDRAGYTETDRQLAQILARTIETALTRVEHEGQLRASRVAVERRTDQIEFFNGVLRHNIRNAMLVVDGHAEHLQSKTDSATEADKLDTIREWCRELTELTETVRAVNDTVTASEDERLEHVDISTVLREQVADLADRYDGVAVALDVDDGVVVVANHLVGDVLSGVLTNAVEHNDSPRPRVTVSTDVVGEWAQVKVADNGPGLSEEMQTQVFQREMATTDTAHGFGLYFVSVMMDLYNGKVWFENGTAQASGADQTESDSEQCDTIVVLEFRLADGSLTQLRE